MDRVRDRDHLSPTPSTSTSTEDQTEDDFKSAKSTTPDPQLDLSTLSLTSPSPSPSPAPPSKRTCVIFQETSLDHRYIRNQDISTIVERPERIRAVKAGISTAFARLEGRGGEKWMKEEKKEEEELDGLMDALSIASTTSAGKGKRKAPEDILGGPFDILFSTSLMTPHHPALSYIHPLPNLAPSSSSADSTPWPQQLVSLCRSSSSSILSPPHSEIPPWLPQGDLYLCEGSEGAIFGSLGAVEEAVDRVAGQGPHDRAFVAVRPPGHHCSQDQPMGFCFVNNLMVAVAHAHQKYNVDRIVIIDIDLHHGNGTQDIVWRINSEANDAYLKHAAMTPASPRKGSPKKMKEREKRKRELQVHFASLHDVFSYPCEDGDPSLVQAASLNLSGGHSQHIANVHLEPWNNEHEFHVKLYHKYRDGLLGSAAEFLEKMRGEEDAEEAGMGREEERTMVFISAGFDASVHESAGMSRHLRNVPVSFYHRFARDACKFATTYANGKIVSILEGGYSDRALTSSSLAFLTGLTESPRESERTYLKDGDERVWWEETNLEKVERGLLGGKKRVGRPPAEKGEEEWLKRAWEIFGLINGGSGEAEKEREKERKEKEKERKTMQLRDRRVKQDSTFITTPVPSPRASKVKGTPRSVPLPTSPVKQEEAPAEETPKCTKTDTDTSTPTPASIPVVPKIKFTWKEGGVH